MKKFFYLCMIALGCMVGFTACGDDDDDEPKVENGEAQIASVIIKDNGTTMTLTVTATQNGQVATAVTTCTFDGSSNDALCIKAEQVATFPSEAWAKQSWEEDYDAEEKASGKLKLSGRTIIQDLTEDFEGLTKLETKLALEYIKALVESELGNDENGARVIPRL